MFTHGARFIHIGRLPKTTGVVDGMPLERNQDRHLDNQDMHCGLNKNRRMMYKSWKSQKEVSQAEHIKRDMGVHIHFTKRLVKYSVT